MNCSHVPVRQTGCRVPAAKQVCQGFPSLHKCPRVILRAARASIACTWRRQPQRPIPGVSDLDRPHAPVGALLARPQRFHVAQSLTCVLQAIDPLRLEAAAAAAPSLVAEIATGPYAPVGALLAGRGAGDVVHTACALAALLRPSAASPVALATA